MPLYSKRPPNKSLELTRLARHCKIVKEGMMSPDKLWKAAERRICEMLGGVRRCWRLRA